MSHIPDENQLVTRHMSEYHVQRLACLLTCLGYFGSDVVHQCHVCFARVPSPHGPENACAAGLRRHVQKFANVVMCCNDLQAQSKGEL